MEEQQNVLQPNWTAWWNHARYTGVPWLSAPLCLKQLQGGACSTSIAQNLSLTQESNGTAPSGSVPNPQSLLSSISSQVLEGITSDVRTRTGPLCSVPPTRHANTAAPPRNSPSWSFCSCVFPNTPSGAQFHHVFMKTSAKHRPRSPTPPRSSHLLSSWRIAISPVLSHRVPIPAPPYFWRQLRRLLHTVLLMPMRPPKSRSRSSFSGASTPKILWIARSHHRHMDLPTAPHFPNPVTSPPSTVSAVPAIPADLMLVHRFHERGSTLHHHSHQVLRIKLP